MVEVLNKLRQPLIINISEEESIHFLANETKMLTYEQLKSQDIQELITKHYLVIIKMN